MTNSITIKAGIDINSPELINYVELLKKQGKGFPFLNLAISTDNPVLSNPLIFDEKEYSEYKVDDLSFIIENNEIIGHMFYSLNKARPTIDLGSGRKNHLDREKIKELSGRISFNRIEYVCTRDISINNIIIDYLSARINNKLEYTGNFLNENKTLIKKQQI